MTLKLPELFGLAAQPAAAASTSRMPTATSMSNQRQALRAALRETLRRNGIAESWVGVEALVRMGKSQEPRLDVRLLIRYWDANLLVSSMALQEDFKRRLRVIDPQSAEWLTGVCWQFALPDDAQYPALTPTRARPSSAPPAKVAAPQAAASRGASVPLAREELLRMFAEPSQPAKADQSYAATEPAALH